MAQIRLAVPGMGAATGRRTVQRRIDSGGDGVQPATISMPASAAAAGRAGWLNCNISLFSSLAAARQDWLVLQSTAMVHPFQDWHWHDSWHKARTPTAGESLMIAVVRDASGMAKALYPLHVLPLVGRQTWVQPMAQDVSDYASPLIAPDFAAAAGPEGLGQLFAFVLSLRGSRGGWHALRQPGPAAGYHTGRLRDSSLSGHEALLYDNWTDWYEARRSLKTRKNDRYRERRLAAEGAVDFIKARTPEQAISFTSFAIEVKRRQLAGRGIRSAFDDPEVCKTFLDLAGRQEGPLRAFMLQVDGAAVAAVVCLVGGGRCCYVISSYEAGKYDAHSPGAVLLRRVLEWGCSQSFEVFDFTIGDESYKFDWSERRLPLYYATGGDTVTGVLKAGGIHLRQLAERIVRTDDRLLHLSQRVRSTLLR